MKNIDRRNDLVHGLAVPAANTEPEPVPDELEWLDGIASFRDSRSRP
ncbi:hypothetical protein [Pyxidicoccus sp. MSG2]|nr:hypothetical protein [Pyxidicoccus sp. MSG2]MCY1017632.1 hypothetical protein [Pyxidicoccus sp. MSG2]